MAHLYGMEFRTPPAPEIPKRDGKSGYFLLSAFTALPGIALAAVVVAVYYAELKIAPLFSGEWTGTYTTSIYSAPFRLRPGMPLTPRELRRRLERLEYKPVDPGAEGAPGPGTYREIDGRWEIHLRGFDHPDLRCRPGLAAVLLDGDKIASVARRDRKGEAALEHELLYELSGDQRFRREPLKSDHVAQAMMYAVVAMEDRRFYQHPGVDLRGIGRAAVRNVRAGRVAQGGSTLTQQLARTLFLTSRRTFSRKATEVLIAFYIEARFPKDQILRMYLDSVYFGQRGSVSIVGLVAAARHFFDKRPEKLALHECALLAGLLASPRLFNPFENPDAALERRNLVLEAMSREGFITRDQESKARAAPLDVTLSGQHEPREADYFVAYVQRDWERRWGSELPLSRGLRLYTTLDPWLQERAREAALKAKNQAALVALDPRTGAVRALVGGKDYAESPFDRASQALRQPGSAFKPFVYGAALEDPRWTPSTLLSDAARRYRIAAGPWTPRNYDGWYRGSVTLRQALAESLNGATVRLAHELGPEKAVEYAARLGILSPVTPDLGVALGVYEVSLLELTAAYAAFANGGFRVRPYAVSVARDVKGRVVERHEEEPERVLDSAHAERMKELLREVAVSGTARSLKRWGLAHLAAGKTGTTDDGKDAWFIGFTPRVLAGAWSGSDLPAALGLSGSGAALPIWADFVRSGVHPDEKPPKPKEPEPKAEPPAVARMVDVFVDPGTGMLARSGCPAQRKVRFPADQAPQRYCTVHTGGLKGWFSRLFAK